MRKFDTKVQHLKYKVLREVARQAWKDTLFDNRFRHSEDYRAGQNTDYALLRLQGACHSR